MARTSVEFLDVTVDDLSAVLDVMAELAAEPMGSAPGWLLIDPAYDDRFPPPTQTSFGRLLSGRGPAVPRASWVPAQARGPKREPMSIGILHATGAKAVDRLAEKELPVPDRWRIVADHAKRGLVGWVPIDVPHDEVLAWLLPATAALTRIPLTGDWRVAVHRPG